MGNKPSKKKPNSATNNDIQDTNADYKQNDHQIVELSIDSVQLCISNGARQYSSCNNNTLTLLPNEIYDIIIDYTYYFIVTSQSLTKFRKLQSQNEPIFKFHKEIQNILKAIQLRIDPSNYDKDKYISFLDKDYDDYKYNKLTMDNMTDISIEFIHNALAYKCITRENVADFLTHFRMFRDNDYKISYKFFSEFLKKSGLHEYCMNTNNNLLDSVRYFLNECGIDMPKEARKIERLLEAFAGIYSKLNKDVDGGVWSESDTVFVAVNGLLMFNCSCHNPRIKPKDKLSIETAKRMFSGIDCVTNKQLFAEKMVEMCKDIQKNPLVEYPKW